MDIDVESEDVNRLIFSAMKLFKPKWIRTRDFLHEIKVSLFLNPPKKEYHLSNVVYHQARWVSLSFKRSKHKTLVGDLLYEPKKDLGIIDSRLLTETERSILYDHFWMGMTFEEIGKKNGYTRQRAHQHYTSALEKLRNENVRTPAS